MVSLRFQQISHITRKFHFATTGSMSIVHSLRQPDRANIISTYQFVVKNI